MGDEGFATSRYHATTADDWFTTPARSGKSAARVRPSTGGLFRSATITRYDEDSRSAAVPGLQSSRYYLSGSIPKRLLEAVYRPHRARRILSSQIRSRATGVAAGLGIMGGDSVYIGKRDAWGGDPALFGVAPPDRRHHMYVIGQTGSGKTTLLRNLIVQHLAAGHGVGLIDPHGDLAEDLLNHIPPWRSDHLAYFNPGDLDFPVALNLLANVSVDERHLVASGIVGAFKSLWRDSWGPRLEYILYNALAALLDCHNTTLLGVNRLLTDPQYRDWVIRQVRDPFIRAFWLEEYASYDTRFMREAIAPIQNKLGQFLLNPVVRNILGQVQCKISFRFIMDNQRILLANLSKGRVGHDKANLLGSLLTTQFQLAAMARVNQPEDERRDFYLFIDEFQNFSTDAFAAMLAEARKYRLCLTLSHQYIDQLSLPVRQAVFGNAGTLIAFRVGHADARILEDEFGKNFTAQHFVELDRYHVLVKLLEDGIHREPFRAATIAPIQIRTGRSEALVARSRERFAASRSQVENKLRRWASGDLSQPEPRSGAPMNRPVHHYRRKTSSISLSTNP